MTAPTGTPIARDQLASALHDAGWHLLGELPAGTDGARWGAQGPAGPRAVVTVLRTRSSAHAGALRDRVERLQAVVHEHLPQTRRVLDLPGGCLAVVQDEVAGPDLATVAAARSSWAPGEVVTVLVPVAGALAAMHAAGLSHGDVAPANVVLTGEGRPVLVDLVCGDDPLERGTPGVVAPERPRGARPPGDVYSLARLGLRLLGADEDRADPEREAVLACLRAASAVDPAARPTAAEVATSLYRACRPVPVMLPDPAVLARVALRRMADLAAADRTQRTVPRSAVRGRHRVRRGHHASWTGAAVLVLLGLTGAAVSPPVRTTVMAVVAGGSDPAAVRQVETVRPVGAPAQRTDRPPVDAPPVNSPADADDPEYPADPVDPVDAAVRLTVDRARALLADDVRALRDVTVPGSPASLADVLLWHRLTSAGASPDAVTVEVVEVRRLPPGLGSFWCRCVHVLLTARAAAPVPGRGTDVPAPQERPPGTEVRSVVLVLRAWSDGWRVSEVLSADR